MASFMCATPKATSAASISLSDPEKLLKFPYQPPIMFQMTISNQPSSLLDSILTAQTTRQDTQVAVLKKAQDAEKMEGEAMVRMLEQSGPQANGKLLDVYA